MKSGIGIIIVGIIMVLASAVLFYSIQGEPSLEDNLRFLKHGGTFAGLMGIGVVMAGILLYLIGREEPQIQDDFGS